MKSRYFRSFEFDCPKEKGSGELMDETFIAMLTEARAKANIPFKINSGFRTPKHNKKVGGKSNSSHLYGLACDIHCSDSRSRFIVLTALIDAGFNRIGVGNTFIHCDIDINKPTNVIWTY